MPAARWTRQAWRHRVVRSLVVWAVLGLLALLDRHGPQIGQHAAVFSFIVSAISWVASAVGDLGAAVATAAETAVVFLGQTIAYVGHGLATLMSNTGAMFSKVWEGAKIVYSDVLKPVAQWFHDVYDKVKNWMVDVFGPVIKWANRVKDELQSLYKRFVQPILKILDTSKAVLDILAKLHVPFAANLENVVNDIEQTILENYLRVLGYVNKAISTLNGFFTVDGLLQRFVLLRSIERDAYFIWRTMVNTGERPLTDLEAATLDRAGKSQTVDEMVVDIVAYFNDEENDTGAAIDSAVDLMLSDLRGQAQAV